MLNVDLRSTLLMLGNTRASSVLLSLNRNVNLLTVNSHRLRLCRFYNPQPDKRASGHWAVPLSLAKGSGDRREPMPVASYFSSHPWSVNRETDGLWISLHKRFRILHHTRQIATITGNGASSKLIPYPYKHQYSSAHSPES